MTPAMISPRSAGFFKQTKRVIVPLTVQEILDEQIAHKLA